MNGFFNNPELCPDCPMRVGLAGDPNIAVELGCKVIGIISNKGRTASFEMDGGTPVGDRESTIAVGIEGDPVRGNAIFTVSGHKFDNGEVEEAFKQCDSPIKRKAGFLRRKPEIRCGAVEGLQEK